MKTLNIKFKTNLSIEDKNDFLQNLVKNHKVDSANLICPNSTSERLASWAIITFNNELFDSLINHLKDSSCIEDYNFPPNRYLL